MQCICFNQLFVQFVYKFSTNPFIHLWALDFYIESTFFVSRYFAAVYVASFVQVTFTIKSVKYKTAINQIIFRSINLKKQNLVESKRGNLLQIFRTDKAFGIETHEYTFWENARVQAWGCAEQGFLTSQRLSMCELATIVYLVSCIS